MKIHIARIYDEADNTGFRVLVDRLWPRGVSREKAQLDVWAKDIAPSPELRQWFDHKSERFSEFSVRYMHELDGNPALPEFIKSITGQPQVTLLYAAKDPQVNHAVVLQKYLEQKV